MLRDIDNYFLIEEEPVKSTMLFLRDFILSYHADITEDWKYRMPFYFYKGQRFCYLRINRKTRIPYIGFTDGKLLDHPELIAEVRARMKIMIIDPLQDMPVELLNGVLGMAIALKKKK